MRRDCGNFRGARDGAVAGLQQLSASRAKRRGPGTTAPAQPTQLRSGPQSRCVKCFSGYIPTPP
jgi:hypothetical protein